MGNYIPRSYAGMLKNQRQNLVMESEFHIKEERVKAQQSSAKTHDKDSAQAADSASKEDKSSTPATTPKAKAIKSEGTDLKSIPGPTMTTTTAKEATKLSAKSKPSQEVTVKREGNSASSSSSSVDPVPATKKNGEKTPKEKTSGKGKPAVREEATAIPRRDIAPTDDATSSSTSQPVSGTTTPSSRHGSPLAVHNGPAASAGGASPKTGQRRQMQGASPDPAAEKGVASVI